MTGIMAGKAVIVTGGAGWIGGATCRWLAEEGASVVVADIALAGAQQLADELQASGAAAAAAQVDLADDESVRAMVDLCLARFGRLDGLVANAADVAMTAIDGDFLSTDLSVWDRTYQVNLRGTVLCCRLAVPHILAQGGGAIVIISSTHSLRGDVRRIAYSASKAGLNVVAQSIAASYGKQGLRCNAVCPGPILDKARNFPEAATDIYRATVLTPDVGSSQQAAELIGFLMSDRASFITGQVIAVDGGMTSYLPPIPM